MNKNEPKKELRQIEKELSTLLTNSFIDFDESNKSKTVISAIKKQIENVAEAKVLLEKYEILAKKLYNIDDDDDLLVLKKEENIQEKVNNVTKTTNLSKLKNKHKKEEKQRESC